MAVKDGIPCDDTLIGLSQKIGKHWKWLARELKVDESKVDKFNTENEELEEKAYKMLLHWRQRDGANATYQTLYTALSHEHVGCKDLARTFCLSKTSTS